MKSALTYLGLASAICSAALSVTPLAAQEVTQRATADEAGIPAPEAWDYVRMTPEERLALRARVRALPADKEEQHNNALSAQVKKLPTWIYEALSNELVALDYCKTGTYTGPMPPPPVMTGWDYARRVPHQRYHYRLRARNLNPADQAVYDAHLARELATLPLWLQKALAAEAERYDARLGLTACPHPQF